MHVHSTFSDGRGTLEENIAEAERLGLRQLGCVDHVRFDTDWVPDYVAAVQRVRQQTAVQMQCGIEAKILDTAGRLDMPDWVDGVDVVYAADHQVPSVDGPLHPRAVRERIESGELAADAVVADIVGATAAAVRVNSNVVIAHLFSILPKIGVDEATVDAGLIEQLADAAASTVRGSRSTSAGTARRPGRSVRSSIAACRCSSRPTATARRRSPGTTTAAASTAS